MKKKQSYTTILLFVIFFAGLSLLLYPSISNYLNSMHQSKAVASYVERAQDLSKEERASYFEQAHAYNASLLERVDSFYLSESQRKVYENTLDITGTGIMGYVEIPTLDVTLPIYHGTEDSILQVAVGHLDWSSLPVGGMDTHCVISGHRGLPSAKLFTHIDQLVEGDRFMLRVLNTTLTYEVDQILIVEPKDLQPLEIVRGQDYCTLVTCTPYGINSHRLLVRGHCVENEEPSNRVVAEVVAIDKTIVAFVISIPLLVVFLLFVLFRRRGEK